MSSKKIAKVGVTISFLVAILILVIEYFRQTLCPGILCIYNIIDIAEPLFFFLISLFLVFFILIFTKQQIFTTWKKFAIPYITLSAIILILPNNGGGGIIFIDDEIIAITLSVFFFIISILIIAIKSWKLRKNIPKQTEQN